MFTCFCSIFIRETIHQTSPESSEFCTRYRKRFGLSFPADSVYTPSPLQLFLSQRQSDCVIIHCDVCSAILNQDSKDYIANNLNDQWMGVSLASQYNVSNGSANFLVRLSNIQLAKL